MFARLRLVPRCYCLREGRGEYVTYAVCGHTLSPNMLRFQNAVCLCHVVCTRFWAVRSYEASCSRASVKQTISTDIAIQKEAMAITTPYMQCLAYMHRKFALWTKHFKEVLACRDICSEYIAEGHINTIKPPVRYHKSRRQTY